MNSNFSYIFERIDPKLIRALSALDDEALKTSFAVLVCELNKGIKSAPNKVHKIYLARELIRAGVGFGKVKSLTKICKNSYYKLKKGEDG